VGQGRFAEDQLFGRDGGYLVKVVEATMNASR
jgi:hypothetical protein